MSYFVRKNKPHVRLYQSDPEPNEEPPRLEFSMSRSKNLAWLTYFQETCSAHIDQIVSEEGISERREVRRRRRYLMGERSAKWEKIQKERREQRKANRAHTDQMSSEEDISGREEEEARRLARVFLTGWKHGR